MIDKTLRRRDFLEKCIVRGGPMPLAVLAQEVDAWVAAKKAGG